MLSFWEKNIKTIVMKYSSSIKLFIHTYKTYTVDMFCPSRKEGGRCGFAESMPRERITVLKKQETPVETEDIKEKAKEIIQKAEPPSQMYPPLKKLKSPVWGMRQRLKCHTHTHTKCINKNACLFLDRKF